MLLLKGWHPLPLVTNVLHSPLVQGQLILLIPLMIRELGDIAHFFLLLVLFALNTFCRRNITLKILEFTLKMLNLTL